MKATAVFLMILVVLMPVRPALASSLTSQEKAELKHYFESATKHYQLGEFQEALDEYKAAYRIRRDGSFLYNMAQCYRQMKHWEDAKREYEAFLRESPNTSKRGEVEILIAQMEGEIQRQKAQAPPTDVVQPPPEVKPDLPKILVAVPPPEPVVAPKKSRWWIPVVIVAGAVVVGGAVAAGIVLSKPNNENAAVSF